MRQTSKTPSAQAKKRIQALIREIAIARDGGCILRNYPESGNCGYYTAAGNLVLQAEHLVSREHSVSYGDMRNIVCLCNNHHMYFKKKNGLLYWELVRKHIGADRWEWVKIVEADRKPYPMSSHDWLKVEVALIQDLAQGNY